MIVGLSYISQSQIEIERRKILAREDRCEECGANLHGKRCPRGCEAPRELSGWPTGRRTRRNYRRANRAKTRARQQEALRLRRERIELHKIAE